MPIYKFFCNYCNEEFEAYRSILSDDEVTCPECCEYTNKIVPVCPAYIITSSASTLGGLADRNAARLGLYERQERQQSIVAANKKMGEYSGRLPDGASPLNKPGTSPWWRPNGEKIDTSLAKMSAEQQKNYILDGVKPIL